MLDLYLYQKKGGIGMKKLLSLLMALFMAIGVFSVPQANAETTDAQEVKKVKQFVENNTQKLISKLENLQNKENVTLEDIEKTIDKHYAKYQEEINAIQNSGLSLEQVFPGYIAKAKKAQEKSQKNDGTFSVNQFFEYNKEYDELGQTFTFKHNKGQVEAFVGILGDVVLMDRSTEPTIQGEVSAMAGPRITPWDSTVAVCYSTLGVKLFTLAAEGQFSYTGYEVSVYSGDGWYNRHFWGATMSLTNRGMGKSRNVSTGGYQYSEIYSQLGVEAVFGFRWAGIPLNSTTAEVYIGSTVNGNLYGGAKNK
jgi:uncharacterized protein YoxC